MPRKPGQNPIQQFKIGDEAQVRADGRVGKVLEFWQQRNNNSATLKGYKYLVEFPGGKREYFLTINLKVANANNQANHG